MKLGVGIQPDDLATRAQRRVLQRRRRHAFERWRRVLGQHHTENPTSAAPVFRAREASAKRFCLSRPSGILRNQDEFFCWYRSLPT
jgi:hypothetical protein